MPTPSKKTPATPAPKPEPVVRDKARMLTGFPSGTKPAIIRANAPITLRAVSRESAFTPEQRREIDEAVKHELALLVQRVDVFAVLSLFHRNLQATDAWYQSRKERPEADVYVTVGIATSGVAYCLELAMAGKTWEPAMAEPKKGEKAGGK